MDDSLRLVRRFLGCVAAFFGLTFGGATATQARDVFVLLSGGDSPGNNNFSQYLQARAVAGYFQHTYPANSVWTFFGAGNVAGAAPVFSDVRHDIRRGGRSLESWTVGALANNRPARREIFLRALREEILPAVAEGGTLFLFVGDHGSRTRGKEAESDITLWGYTPDATAPHGWRYDDDQNLKVSDLRDALRHGLGRGRVVFCMTQCHSGGFHFLSVPREMTANPRWFTNSVAASPVKAAPVFPLAAGFTATDEMSLASGCDPDPDPDQWAGYERYLPENLLGLDLLSLQPAGKPLPSFAAAHIAATLVDCTIDKPYSTSEQYLERWAELIEKKLVGNPRLKPELRKPLAAYQRAVDGMVAKVSNSAFNDRAELFYRFTERLTDENPTVRRLVRVGTRQELERVIRTGDGPETEVAASNPPPADSAPRRGRGGRGGGRGAGGQTRRLWATTIRPAWTAAIAANETPGLPAAAREFELHLLRQEAGNTNVDFFSPRGRSRLNDEVFWGAGYGEPKNMDPVKAEIIIRWGQERRAKILDWAKQSDDDDVRAAAETLSQARPGRGRNGGSPGVGTSTPAPETADLKWPLAQDVAAERTLFYRRVLAAWQFLIAMDERPALARVRELTELERTPLPPPPKPH